MEEKFDYNANTITYKIKDFMRDMDEVSTSLEAYAIIKHRMKDDGIIFPVLADNDEEFEQLLKCFMINEDNEYKARWDFAEPYVDDFVYFINEVKESMIDDSFNCNVENYDEMFDVFRCNYEFDYNWIVDDYYKDKPEEIEEDLDGDIKNGYYCRLDTNEEETLTEAEIEEISEKSFNNILDHLFEDNNFYTCCDNEVDVIILLDWLKYFKIDECDESEKALIERPYQQYQRFIEMYNEVGNGKTQEEFYMNMSDAICDSIDFDRELEKELEEELEEELKEECEKELLNA